ncbi:uncharacterized protein L969DRAFT_89727 [Mixia osmundae IAM 14324]|nr:uncharacterized protein L969DRAFT_89727 [Mixia osmundae IAM 14324]KEI37757.1 hypothetical protein L969DRAFT_89727 [Mixia osmundae IAM 14324]
MAPALNGASNNGAAMGLSSSTSSHDDNLHRRHIAASSSSTNPSTAHQSTSTYTSGPGASSANSGLSPVFANALRILSAHRRQLVLALAAISASLLLLNIVAPDHFGVFWSGTGLLGRKGTYLPGYGYRSGSSRRLDAHLRAKTRTRSALGGGSVSSVTPANFTEAPPFTFCPTFGESDEIGQLYGSESLMKTRAHVGSSDRVRKVIRRAMAGLPITIGVLGGSISACHGLDATQAHPLGNPVGPNCYPHRLFSWLNDVFPHPANELTNGALRRTNSAYFGYCSQMHLPDRVDIVIVEFDTEDPHDKITLTSMDLLIRSILLRPDQPAVIMLGHFSPQLQGEHGFAGPEVWHSAVAQFYDVVHLSVKGLLYEEYLINPQKVRQSYFLDPVLANAKGHELLADTVIGYLEAEICTVWDHAAIEAEMGGAPMPFTGSGLAAAGAVAVGGGADAPSGLLGGKGLRKGSDAGLDAEDGATSQTGSRDALRGAAFSRIPAFRILDKPHTIQNFREIKPNCASANDLINPLPASVFAGTGWTAVTPKPSDEDERHYWYSETPGSKLKVPIKVGAGEIAVYYLQGPESDGWGKLKCNVDDNYGGAVELNGVSDSGIKQPKVTIIDRGVGAGSHFVFCELQGQISVDVARFKIYGVFST